MKQLFGSIFVLFFLASSVFGQAAPVQKLTLQKAIDFALNKNVTVAQAQNNVAAAQSGVLAGYGGYLPSLTASGYWNREQTTEAFFSGVTFVHPTTTTNYFNASVSSNWTIFNGFAREASLKKAIAGEESTNNIFTRTKQQIVNSVQADYLTVLRNEQLVKVSEENLKRDQKQLDQITESHKVGALAIADVYNEQSVVAADELSLIQAQNTYDESKADLIALIGLDASVDFPVADESISPDISQTDLDSTQYSYQNMDQFRKTAMAYRPDYQSALALVRSAQADETSASSRYYPGVTASASYALNNTEISNLTDNKGLSWGLNLSWSLFDNFATNQTVQTAAVEKMNADLNVLQTERNVSVDVKKALLNLESGRKQYTASIKSLQSATQNQKVAEERYNLGAGTLVDLLTADAGLVNAEAGKINAAFNYIMSKMNLDLAIGRISY
ncbi:MAG TPA: TolC family protein [Bacteroidota bacterium]|nr:TolC family protein [Bacteroidota bacterium]